MDNIKKQITSKVISLRKDVVKKPRQTPRFIELDKIKEDDGSIKTRKKVIIVANGCSIPTCTMCPFTNENYYGLKKPVNGKSILDQVKTAIKPNGSTSHYDILALYNDGSFFSPKEIPENIQWQIAEAIS